MCIIYDVVFVGSLCVVGIYSNYIIACQLIFKLPQVFVKFNQEKDRILMRM